MMSLPSTREASASCGRGTACVAASSRSSRLPAGRGSCHWAVHACPQPTRAEEAQPSSCAAPVGVGVLLDCRASSCCHLANAAVSMLTLQPFLGRESFHAVIVHGAPSSQGLPCPRRMGVTKVGVDPYLAPTRRISIFGRGATTRTLSRSPTFPGQSEED